MNSEASAGALPNITPIPRPEMKRRIAKTVTEAVVAIQLTASMLRPTRNIAATNKRRRPSWSDSGAKPAAPMAIPNNAALNNGPKAARSRPQEAATLGAVTDMATTSIPSARFNRNPSRTTNHMSGTTGPSSMRARTRSALMVFPLLCLRLPLAPGKMRLSKQPIDRLDDKTKQSCLSAGSAPARKRK